MREEIANIVHPVLHYGIRLKQRLERGESLDLPSEQAQIKGMLLGEMESRRWAEYGGEAPDVATMSRLGGGGGRRSPDQFLGIRYALACWLDEIFILDSVWEDMWNERKIEEALYSTNDRAWLFWEQAQLAETRPGTDSIEVYYLCVMLGFRGEMRDSPDRLKAWSDNAAKRIGREKSKEWTAPPELDPPVYVPPLHGREKMQRMVMTVAGFVLFLVPAAAFFLILQIFRDR